MSTQQEIYAFGFENRPPMLNKENYVPWSSRLLRYAKSRPNGMLIYNSIINGPYVRRMIPEPSDQNHEVPINETFHEQTDDELAEKELKLVEADDQAIQTILLGLPKDIYAAIDSCETAQKIWILSLSRVDAVVVELQHEVLQLLSSNHSNLILKSSLDKPEEINENFRSLLSRPRPDTITKSLTPSPDGSQRCRVMPATPSPCASRPNGKLIYNSIINGPYVRRMIPEQGDQNRKVSVNETFHVKMDDELTEKELKQVKADDQTIQTILLGLPEDIHAVVDSYETA
nr:hypothetical protein [Tanacetum cinerariifolium]